MEYKVQSFVPKSVFARFGEKSWQFVSDNIVTLYDFANNFFNEYYKAKDATVDYVEVMCNNYHQGGTFENRGLRTVDYINSQVAKGIKTAMLSQHVGGSTNAMDINIIIHYIGGRTLTISSDLIYDIVLANAQIFMGAGLTTLENKSMTKGWTHMDCRFTGLKTIYIVNP